MTKEEYLDAMKIKQGTAPASVALHFRPEILQGYGLREQYSNATEIPQEELARQEITPSIGYVKAKGQVGDYEPAGMDVYENLGSLPLMRAILYKTLLEEQR